MTPMTPMTPLTMTTTTTTRQVPTGDVQFDPLSTGNATMPFSRSKFGVIYGDAHAEGDPLFEPEDLEWQPREAINWVTPVIDGTHKSRTVEHKASVVSSFPRFR